MDEQEALEDELEALANDSVIAAILNEDSQGMDHVPVGFESPSSHKGDQSSHESPTPNSLASFQQHASVELDRVTRASEAYDAVLEARIEAEAKRRADKMMQAFVQRTTREMLETGLRGPVACSQATTSTSLVTGSTGVAPY